MVWDCIDVSLRKPRLFWLSSPILDSSWHNCMHEAHLCLEETRPWDVFKSKFFEWSVISVKGPEQAVALPCSYTFTIRLVATRPYCTPRTSTRYVPTRFWSLGYFSTLGWISFYLAGSAHQCIKSLRVASNKTWSSRGLLAILLGSSLENPQSAKEGYKWFPIPCSLSPQISLAPYRRTL